jgi:formate dehydrogenase alpha subunit
MTNSISDLGDADVVFVIGSNTTEAHPVISLELIKAVRQGGKTLVVADPRKIDIARRAHLHLQLKPGTNVALLKGMMRHIVDLGLEDREFIASRTENYEQLVESLKTMTVEEAAVITGVPADDIRKAAELYGRAGAANILFAMGITQHHTGVNNVLSVANLAMLTGNIGRPGTGVNPLRGQANVQGACDMGSLPDVFSGYQKVDNPEFIAKMEEAWGVTLADREKGKTLVEIMRAVHDGEIRALYIMGENPILSDADQHHVEETLSKAEFLVVQDIFLTETAEYADVVLPATTFAEKDGTFTNTERRIQRVRKALEPLEDCLPDWQIVQLVANRMGAGWSYGSPQEIMEEIAQVTPQYGGVSYDRLEEVIPDASFEQMDACGLQWPCPTEDHPGTPILHTQAFARGKGFFSAIEYIVPDEQPDAEYQLVLTTGRELVHYHTGTMTRQAPGLNALVPDGRLEINPDDARRLGVVHGERCRVTSRRGSIEPVAWVTDRVSPGLVFMPFHYVEAPANRLTNPILDPISKIPEFKVATVHVEPLVMKVAEGVVTAEVTLSE